MTATLRSADIADDLSRYVHQRADGGEEFEILVKGARCANCIAKIEAGVKGVAGVAAARLNLSSGKLVVRSHGASPHAILRRVRGDEARNEPRAQVRFDQWRLDSVLRQLHSPEGLVVPLSNAEFRLLWVFLERPRRVLNRELLLDAARGRAIEAFDRSIDLLVSRLRQKLGDDPRSPRLIKTVRGEGYLFDVRDIA